jgi:hypothetical protein
MYNATYATIHQQHQPVELALFSFTLLSLFQPLTYQIGKYCYYLS